VKIFFGIKNRSIKIKLEEKVIILKYFRKFYDQEERELTDERKQD
jgi:predicted ATPase